MPTLPVTPAALLAALAAHRTAEAACRAVGISKQGAYQRDDLAAVLREHFAAERQGREPRNSRRKLGEHHLAILPETLARLDALATELVPTLGKQRASRAGVARQLLASALTAPLPAGAAAPYGTKTVKLDLGTVWERLATQLGTLDTETIAGVVRAVLATQEIDTGNRSHRLTSARRMTKKRGPATNRQER